MTENWNLNNRNYTATFGEPKEFGLHPTQGIFLRRQFVAEIVRVDNLENEEFQVNFTGSPILEIAGSYDQIGRMMGEINFREIAKLKIRRFLLGDRARWLKDGGTWILGLEAAKAGQIPMGDILGDEKMQIEWSQITEGKQDDDNYIVSEVGQVFVSQYEIEKAQKLGGNPLVELRDATSADSDIPQYVVTKFIPRSADSQRVAMQDAKRLLALRQIYDATDGLINETIDWSSICRVNLWAEKEAEDVLSFLTDRGLIELRTLGPTIGLTRSGIDEIENAIRHPRNKTHSFPASAVQLIMSNNSVNVSGGSVGAIQSNNQNAQANVQQNIGLYGQELFELFTQMRQELQQLPEVQRAEALEYLEDLETESKADEPKQSRLKSSGKALWELASGVFSTVSIAYLNNQLGVGN